MSDEIQKLTFRDLKDDVLTLKMSTLSDVEESAANEILAMIKGLPGPEVLDSLDAGGIKSVKKAIGRIRTLIEQYSKRDMEYKARYKSKKGMPPRYKVINWRDNMNSKASVVKEMVRVSSVADEKGYGEFSDKLLVSAKKIMNDESVDFSELQVMAKKYDMEKEAGIFDTVGAWAGAAGDRVKQEWGEYSNLATMRLIATKIDKGLASNRGSIEDLMNEVANAQTKIGNRSPYFLKLLTEMMEYLKKNRQEATQMHSNFLAKYKEIQSYSGSQNYMDQGQVRSNAKEQPANVGVDPDLAEFAKTPEGQQAINDYKNKKSGAQGLGAVAPTGVPANPAAAAKKPRKPKA